MQEGLFNKTNLIVFLLVILAIVISFWLMVPSLVKMCAPIIAKMEEQVAVKKEAFTAEGGQVVQQVSSEKLNQNKAFINPQVGSLMDGPGFEKGNVDGISQDALSTIPSNYYFLDDGADGALSIQHNLCSKSCCSSQWPTPFKQKYDPYVCGNKDQYVPSKLMCNNSFQDSGCLCLTKDQAQHIYSRGQNASSFF